MDLSELRQNLATALVAVDYDGTLAPIVADPMQAVPAPGAVDALAALASRGAQVAVVTGRPAQVAVDLGGLDAIPNLVVEGLYGAERWVSGELRTAEAPPALDRAREALPGLLDGADPALWVEDKRLSLVVHSRGAADPDGALATLRPHVTALAERLDLEVHDGRAVLELRLPGYDKGGVLRWMLAEWRPSHLLFAGDDVGDLPAFDAARAARADGISVVTVAVASAEAPDVASVADVSVPDPAGLVRLLAGLV